MLDGVGWAAGEIVFFMLLATLIGFAIAFIYMRWLHDASIADSFEADLAAQADLARKAEHRLIESNKTLDKLQEELRHENTRVGELEAQLESVSTQLSSQRGDGPHRLAEMARLEGRVSELEDLLAARDERIVELEAGMRRAPEVPQPPGKETETRQPSVADVAPSKEEGIARIAEIAARTAGDAPPADDDLKKVRGIGPKLERTLKDLGITSFRQIANFQPEDIAYVTAALSAFKGRIERDDWMGGAAHEHEKKYREPV
jgi:predicted flap endonuclease-1-like 5' DNA nuclease